MQINAALCDYTRADVAREWPAHRQGETSEEAGEVLERFENDPLKPLSKG